MDVFTPRVGQLVRDRRTGRVGEYMDTIGGERYLRPEGGGKEWAADPVNVGPVAPDLEYANPAGAPKGSLRSAQQ
ncbi:hypothetical protein ACFZDG_11030 [Kitasatospora xanthocidica]|uniref:hypothetical protein n=1 Tax=Kitasatospora xanthocidica TaxID=83382 RepID=UPI0036E0465A